MTKNVNIKLTNSQFLTATFITGGTDTRGYGFSAHRLSFKSSKQTQTQYYICDKRSGHDKITKMQHNDIAHLPLLSVETNANIKVEVAEMNKVILR
jgi:hypothetical protein